MVFPDFVFLSRNV